MTRIVRNLVLVALVCTACGAQAGSRTPRGSANLITSEEVQASGYADAYAVVQSLRPQWLRVRGTSSLASREFVKVYLDGSLLGGTDYLRQIATTSISTLQYLDGLQATQRWGLDHGAGAIVVSTRGRSHGALRGARLSRPSAPRLRSRYQELIDQAVQRAVVTALTR